MGSAGRRQHPPVRARGSWGAVAERGAGPGSPPASSGRNLAAAAAPVMLAAGAPAAVVEHRPERQGPDSCWSGASQADPCTPARPASASRQPASPQRAAGPAPGRRGRDATRRQRDSHRHPQRGQESGGREGQVLGSAGGRGGEGRLATHLALPPPAAPSAVLRPPPDGSAHEPHAHGHGLACRGIGSTALARQPRAGCLAGGARSRQQPPAQPCPQRDSHTISRSHTAASEPSHGKDSLEPRGCRPAGGTRGLAGGRDAGAVPVGGRRLWPAPVTDPVTASLSHVVTGSRRRVTDPTSAPSNSIRRAGPAVHSIHTEHPAGALYGETWSAISPPGPRVRIRPLAYPSCRSSHSGTTTGPVAALAPVASAGPGVVARAGGRRADAAWEQIRGRQVRPGPAGLRQHARQPPRPRIRACVWRPHHRYRRHSPVSWNQIRCGQGWWVGGSGGDACPDPLASSSGTTGDRPSSTAAAAGPAHDTASPARIKCAGRLRISGCLPNTSRSSQMPPPKA